jgi:CheY-like chemotaxis protein
MINATFFLIDDDEDDRELFQIALEDSDFEISYTSASNGQEALNILLGNEALPDFIFLDLNMPQMDGRECLKELKKHPVLAGIPVIIFSTSSDPRDIVETKQLGAFDFITKPSKISDLTKILQKFITYQLINK